MSNVYAPTHSETAPAVAGCKWKWCELACEGDVAMFEQLPADELAAALKTADEDGRSPLHVAVARGHTPLVQLLLAGPAAAVAEALQRSDDEARSQTAKCGRRYTSTTIERVCCRVPLAVGLPGGPRVWRP
jgi:hypothetical protein